MTTAAAAKLGTPSAAGCGGDGCESQDPWPLHHVRHRSVFRRLCTSCVLRYHPGAFCSSCFDVLDSPPDPDRALVYCSRCPALSHLSCLPDPQAASQYLCPTCSTSNAFSYFPFDGSREASDGEKLSKPSVDGIRRKIDLSSAKILLAASQLAAASMSRAAAAARSDVERKVKEAAIARKRARDMLEVALSVSKREKEKMKESIEMSVAPPSEVVGSKKNISAERKVQDRQRAKPIQMVHRPLVHGLKSHVTEDVKDRLGTLSQPPNHVAQEERGLKVESDNGPMIPQSTQDLSVESRNNTRAVFTGSPNTSSIHS